MCAHTIHAEQFWLFPTMTSAPSSLRAQLWVDGAAKSKQRLWQRGSTHTTLFQKAYRPRGQLDLPWGVWCQFYWPISKLALNFISQPSRRRVIVLPGWWVFAPPASFLFCLPSSSILRDSRSELGSLKCSNFIGLNSNLIVSFLVTWPSLPSRISFSDRFANDSYCSIFSLYCWIILFIFLLLEQILERG